MVEILNIVKKFLEEPYSLSALSIADHYYDYIALFHLLLIKKGIKKGFCISGGTKNGIKICKELKLQYTKADNTQHGITIPEDNSLPEETTNKLYQMHTSHGTSDIICALKSEIVEKYSRGDFDSRSIGELEEYPECCIKQFIKNAWGDFEIIADLIGDGVEMVEQIDYYHRDASRNEKMFEHLKHIYLEFGDGRKKFPYVVHQACTDCLTHGNNSTTGKLNSKWKKICENEFPELNKEIISGAERVYKDKLWWNQSYEEYMKGYYEALKK